MHFILWIDWAKNFWKYFDWFPKWTQPN